MLYTTKKIRAMAARLYLKERGWKPNELLTSQQKEGGKKRGRKPKGPDAGTR